MATDRQAAKEMVEKTKQMGVPVLIFDDKDILIGFNTGRIDELLKKHGITA